MPFSALQRSAPSPARVELSGEWYHRKNTPVSVGFDMVRQSLQNILGHVVTEPLNHGSVVRKVRRGQVQENLIQTLCQTHGV